MGLRELAESDLGVIVEDSETGFGWPITLLDPDQTEKSFTGFSNDIAQLIDPDTGLAVSGRIASVAIRMSSLICAGVSLPVGIADAAKKPWVVRFKDINGHCLSFKVLQSNPDRGLGLITLILEAYKE